MSELAELWINIIYGQDSQLGLKKLPMFPFTNMPKNIRVGRSEILSFFFSSFLWLLVGLVFNKITIKPLNNEE